MISETDEAYRTAQTFRNARRHVNKSVTGRLYRRYGI